MIKHDTNVTDVYQEKLLVIESRVGEGIKEDPVRIIKEYYRFDETTGKYAILWRFDPYPTPIYVAD